MLQQSAGNRAVSRLVTDASRSASRPHGGPVAEPLRLLEAQKLPGTERLPVQRGFLGDVAGGAWSWAKDLGRGAKRTARGLKVWDQDAMIKIAQQNESAWRLFKRLVKNGVSGAIAVFSHLLEIAVVAFTAWKLLPQHIKDLAVKKLGSSAKTMVQKVAAKAVGKWAVKQVVRQLAQRIVRTKGYKMLAKKLGTSAALKATGVGVPLGLLGLQGLIEKASQAAAKLKSQFSLLYEQLAKHDLHMAWFLVAGFVDTLRKQIYDRLTMMLTRSRDGRILIDAGSGDGRTPIRSGGSETRVPIRTSESGRRVPIRTGGGN